MENTAYIVMGHCGSINNGTWVVVVYLNKDDAEHYAKMASQQAKKLFQERNILNQLSRNVFDESYIPANEGDYPVYTVVEAPAVV